MSRSVLVLGGARSGKSRFAEKLAAESAVPKTYIATAEAIDDEMRQRIADHQRRRAGEGWETIEAPLDPAAALAKAGPGVVLLDCVTVWLSNLMHHGKDVQAAVSGLCDAVKAPDQRIIVVSNEVGLSIVPENPLARHFRDAQGLANQRLAEAVDEVYFVAAGLPMKLKG